MTGILAKLMLYRQIEFKDGSIKLLNQPMVMLPFKNLLYIQKLIDEKKLTYELYLTAKELGKEWMENTEKTYHMKSVREQLAWGENALNLSGWGKMRVTEWNKEKKEKICVLENSTIAEGYGNTGKVVCHLIRGWVAGSACTLFSSDVDGLETKCKSKGDAYCKFEVRPRETFDFRKKSVIQQLGEL